MFFILFYCISDDCSLWPLDIEGILLDCKNLISQFAYVSLSWVRRTANMTAHVLVNSGLSSPPSH